MSMHGSCDCKNIEMTWHIVDYSIVPRECECEYCSSKSAAYVTKSGTRFEVIIRNNNLHQEIQHGSKSSVFHECLNCGCVMFVTAEIEGELYGTLNANHLVNKFGFSSAVKTNYSAQSAQQKRERWRRNWCHPVLITSIGSNAPTGLDGRTARRC
jgi:hypothetical protein